MIFYIMRVHDKRLLGFVREKSSKRNNNKPITLAFVGETAEQNPPTLIQTIGLEPIGGWKVQIIL